MLFYGKVSNKNRYSFLFLLAISPKPCYNEIMVIKYILLRNYEYAKNIPTHRHDFYEFVYYDEGSGTSTYNDTTFSFQKGNYLFINPNDPHSEHHIKTPKVVCIGFQDEPFGLTTKHYFDDDGTIAMFVERIKKEYQKKQNYYYDMIKSIVKEIVITLQRKADRTQPPDFSLKPIIDYINAYYMTPLDIKALAEQSCYSIDHFRRIFKKQTGFNPKEYILRLRFDHAKKLLTTTNERLQDVAVNCGFEYYSQFSLFFKGKVKMSPAEYRKKYGKP